MKASNASQLEKLLPVYGKNLNDDQLAEIYSKCIIEEFNSKNYPACRELLQRIINSRAHVEYRGEAFIQLANIYFLENKYDEAILILDKIIDFPEMPDIFKKKAIQYKKQNFSTL